MDQDMNRPSAAIHLVNHCTSLTFYGNIQDGSDLIWVSLNPVAADHEAKKFSRSHSEHTFLGVELYTEGPKYVERLS